MSTVTQAHCATCHRATNIVVRMLAYVDYTPHDQDTVGSYLDVEDNFILCESCSSSVELPEAQREELLKAAIHAMD